MTLHDVLKNRAVFNSAIWSDIVDYVRDYIDPVDEHEQYTINSVDRYMDMEYGTWELLPILHNEDIADVTEIQNHVDAVIAANRDYWTRFIDTLRAEFNPLYNVDATEVTTSHYGEHVTTTDHDGGTTTTNHGGNTRNYTHGAQQDTTFYGEQQITTDLGERQTDTVYGEQKVTAGQRDDEHGHGAQTDTHSSTTMDDLTFKPKTQDTHAIYTDTDTIGEQETTTDEHQDTFMQNAAQDVETSAAYQDSVLRNQYKDTDSTVTNSSTQVDNNLTDTQTSEEHEDRVTLRRYGNIGVTKSTELLEDFREFARRSRIVPIIAVEIAKALTFSVWY